MDIIKPGKNCHRYERSRRAALLVDAQNYFGVLRDVLPRARRQVLIAGWDLDSRIKLVHGAGEEPRFAGLGGLLNGIAELNPYLDVYVLVWDFAMLYALEREPLPVFKLGWKTNRRVRFHMDGEHPFGASHHQKIVVVDDKLAFAGGLDLTKHRWDTRGHKPGDPLRVDPSGKAYGPFHDVQMMADGDTAKALGDLVRERWLRATGEILAPPGETPGDPWPEHVRPDVLDARIAVALTEPAFKGRPEIRQVERLHVDAILAAEESIYIENQYFTSHTVAAALGARLREKGGPEIVMVQPRQATGWLEENTMGAIRSRLVHRLKKEDAEQRLWIYHAVNGEESIKIHGKVMVVDDRFLRVGSANLSNRSMGLDSECDLAMEAENKAQSAAVTSFRNNLLGEHLGAAPEAVAQAVARHGSLARAVEALRGGERTLQPLENSEAEKLADIDVDMLDPEKPVKIDRMIDEFVDEVNGNGGRGWIKYAGAAVLFAAFVALWRFTEFGRSLDVDTVTAWIESVRRSPFAPVYVVLGFVAASIVFFPVTILVIASAAVFPPFQALAYILLGVLCSSAANYYIGRLVGRDLIRRFPGGRLNSLSRRLAKSGLWTVIAVRNIPVAPYAVINTVAGAARIGIRDFLAGTVLGMLPGIVAVTFFTDRLAEALLHPGPFNLALALGLGAALFAAVYFFRRRLRRREDSMRPGHGDSERPGK